MDTARYTYLMDICIKNKRPILFVGPTGTGMVIDRIALLLAINLFMFQMNLLTFAAKFIVLGRYSNNAIWFLGKSAYVKDKLMNNLSKEEFIPAFVNFSAKTTANQTQGLIMSKLDKRRKGIYHA